MWELESRSIALDSCYAVLVNSDTGERVELCFSKHYDQNISHEVALPLINAMLDGLNQAANAVSDEDNSNLEPLTCLDEPLS
jgi:hypothetical protein